MEQLAWRLVSSNPSAEGDADPPPLQESGVFGLPLAESTSFFNETTPPLTPNLDDRDRRWRTPHRNGGRFVDGSSETTVPACFSRIRSSTTISSSVIAAATHSSLTNVLAAADVTFFIDANWSNLQLPEKKGNQIQYRRSEREWKRSYRRERERENGEERQREVWCIDIEERKKDTWMVLYTRLSNSTLFLFLFLFFLVSFSFIFWFIFHFGIILIKYNVGPSWKVYLKLYVKILLINPLLRLLNWHI